MIKSFKIHTYHFTIFGALEKNPNYWTEQQYALFEDQNDVIDYSVTLIGSRHDAFYRIRDYLMANKNILEEHNQLKLSYQGKT